MPAIMIASPLAWICVAAVILLLIIAIVTTVRNALGGDVHASGPPDDND